MVLEGVLNGPLQPLPVPMFRRRYRSADRGPQESLQWGAWSSRAFPSLSLALLSPRLDVSDSRVCPKLALEELLSAVVDLGISQLALLVVEVFVVQLLLYGLYQGRLCFYR